MPEILEWKGYRENLDTNLPALGFAILLRMILNKKIVPFLIIGFVLTAYLNLPVLGVAIMGVCIVLIMAFNNGTNLGVAGTNGVEVDDDDF